MTELVGQHKLIAPHSFLGRMLRGARPSSCILWGPPGSGKTTLARLLVNRDDWEFESFSAVLSGVKEVRETCEKARKRRELEGRGTALFVDEIHRFNKSQQDAFLPHVEAGTIVLIGATTENPSFEIISPLLSRCTVVVLDALGSEDLSELIDRALHDEVRGLGSLGLKLDEDALEFICEQASGDARIALGALEAAADLAESSNTRRITMALAEEGLQKRALLYDRAGEEHYNVISAFIKSMRASDADAAIYWLARMIEAGEDPLFIARRMVVFASEDVGLADPWALPLAIAVKDAVHFVGLPEATINLGHGAAYLARAPKSRASHKALTAARAEVTDSGGLGVPMHLRNAPTRLMKDLGYGRRREAGDSNLPESIAKRSFLQPDEE